GQVYILYVDNYSTTGQAFNLSWQLSGGASLDCSVLPVSFLNLIAAQQYESVEVSWTTQSEEASDHFIIQRSNDGRYFEPIGRLDAGSMSSSAIDYRFLDEYPRNGQNHYRIVRVDVDGRSQISNSVVVHFKAPGDRVIVVPNPAHDRIFLSFTPVNGEVIVQLFDPTGRLLRTWAEGATAGPLTLPIADLETGAYTILVGTTSGEHLGHASFVKE
ncbi:MAG TPA: T9SS type A sorting domain-containing protein, partial [Flavobacteriales bacterium]|nr:T9SS type A sorting domain-containing protein [Flavobacteriales bacterium]